MLKFFKLEHDSILIVLEFFKLEHDITLIVLEFFKLEHDTTLIVLEYFKLEHDSILIVLEFFKLGHDTTLIVLEYFKLEHDIILIVLPFLKLKHDSLPGLHNVYKLPVLSHEPPSPYMSPYLTASPRSFVSGLRMVAERGAFLRERCGDLFCLGYLNVWENLV